MESTNTVGTEDAQAKFRERELAGYTNAYRALVPECEAEGRNVIFDPSLKGYVNGYRVGDPEFTNADDQRVWNEARRRVADYLLHLVTTSVWNDHLVLRGSMLQQAYLGDAVLLAEQTFLPFDLLYRVVQAADEYLLKYLGPDFISEIYIRDADFGEDYSWLEGDTEDWLARLSAALTPTFAGR